MTENGTYELNIYSDVVTTEDRFGLVNICFYFLHLVSPRSMFPNINKPVCRIKQALFVISRLDFGIYNAD